MAGYSRQSTYTTDDTIEASDTNDEFAQLVAAFSASSGHSHDGTSTEGPVLTTVGALSAGSIASGFGTISTGNAITTTALLTAGDLTLTAATPEILGGDADGTLFIAPSTTNALGGNIVLYGNTHASKAKDIEFRETAGVELHYDASASKWDFQANAVATTGAITGSAGVDIAASSSFSVAGTAILSDSSGTMTLSNVDAIDATTETTLESAIDALPNLVTVGTLGSGSIAAGFGAIDNGASNITTGGILKLDIDGSAENAVGSLTLGTGNDAGIFFDGTDLVLITNGAGASGIILDSEDDTVEIKGSGTLQATFNTGGLDLVSGDAYEINGTSVLNATTLGGAVVASSLTSVGTIATGVWAATDIAVAHGGTGASTAAAAATALGVGTGDSPQFTAVNVGAATDTTVTRVSAGVIAVEGATLATLSADNVWTGAQRPTVTNLTSSSNSIAITLGASNDFKHTFTEDSTLANPSDTAIPGQSGSIYLTQHASSPKTLAFGSEYDFAGGTAPTISAVNDARDRLDYVVQLDGKIQVTAVLAFS